MEIIQGLDNQKGNSPKENPKSGNGKIYILLVVIAVLLCTNIYTYLQKSKTEIKLVTVTDERSNLQHDLDQLELQLTEATNSTNKLNASLQAKDIELKAKVEELKNALKRGNLTAADLEKARNEIDQLRYYVKKYQTEISSLKKENEKLTTENTGLKKSVEAEQQKSNTLQNENISLSNKVAVAQLLKAQNITVQPVRYRSNGSEVEASRARKTEKVKVTFNVVDNPIAQKGYRDFFLRIINPNGKQELITDQTENKFQAEGQDMQYTSKINVNFENNIQTPYQIYWSKSSNYDKGVYKAILYADGVSIGSTTFELK